MEAGGVRVTLGKWLAIDAALVEFPLVVFCFLLREASSVSDSTVVVGLAIAIVGLYV